jgi:hypothetical protein
MSAKRLALISVCGITVVVIAGGGSHLYRQHSANQDARRQSAVVLSLAYEITFVPRRDSCQPANQALYNEVLARRAEAQVTWNHAQDMNLIPGQWEDSKDLIGASALLARKELQCEQQRYATALRSVP